MENLIISFNVVLPLFLCIALGYFLRRIGFVDGDTLNKLNKLCFRVFLPIYLFHSVYTTDLSAAFNGKLILLCVLCVLGLFLGLMLLIPRLEKDNAKRGAMVQGMFRSNFVLFGLPVATSLCGEANIGPTSLLIGIIVPIFNVLAVVTLETFRGGKPNPGKIGKGIATNPLILASLLGILCYFLHIKLPYGVEKTVIDLGRVATPLSLVALGGSFTVGKVRSYAKQLLIVVGGKLIMNPLIMVTIGILAGFRNEMLVPILIMFGAPTAVASFPMAQQMDSDGELAAEIVVFTSGFAILTIFLWIFVLKELNFI